MAALLVVASAVAPASSTRQPGGQLIERLATATDPAQTFTAFLPSAYDTSRRWPLLLVFDPRGRGTFAAKIFAPAAERYGWIIVSSNNTRSDGPWEPNAQALTALWPDALARYAVDPRRIYAAGFSGGATLAWAAGVQTGSVAGIIAAGQPSHPAILEKSPAPAWFGAAGRHDFNYRDTRDIRTRLPRGADVRTEFFDGVHQWLTPEVAMRAVGWLEMLAIRDGRRAGDAALVGETLERDTRHTAALEAASRLVEAAETYQALVRTYDGVTSIDELRARLAATTSAPAYRAAVKEDERAARYERSHATNTARTLVHLFGTGRLLHARGLLNQLRVETLQRDAARGGAMGDAARRALEHIFVQTAFYLPNDLQTKGRHSQAATLLEVATAIHPSRPAPWYALAQARAQAGRVDGAFEALDRAADAGFTDAARMEADAAFDRLREDERWGRLQRRIGRDAPRDPAGGP